MQSRGEVLVTGSATSGLSVSTAPPPQPRLKDHPVKKRRERVGEVRGQRGPKQNRVFWTWCDLCNHHSHSSCGHLPRTRPANHLLQSEKEILEISPPRTYEQLMSFEYGLQWIKHTLVDGSEFSSIWAAQIGLGSLLKTKGHKTGGWEVMVDLEGSREKYGMNLIQRYCIMVVM